MIALLTLSQLHNNHDVHNANHNVSQLEESASPGLRDCLEGDSLTFAQLHDNNID